MTIGETQVEGNMNYFYKAYFKTVTQFSASAQSSHMLSSGWCKDEEGKFDDKTNKSFVKRMALIDDSTSAEFFGPLFFDLFNQDRPLISSTDMRIKLQSSKPEFALNPYPTTSTDHKIHFKSVIFYVDRLEMNTPVIDGQAKGLRTQGAAYPINHAEMQSYTIPAGQQSHTKESLFAILSPKMLF